MTNDASTIVARLRVGSSLLIGLQDGHVLSDADFDPVDLGSVGVRSNGPWGNGLYASNDLEVASAGADGNRVHEITIRLESPLVLDPHFDPEGYDEVRASLRKLSVTGARERFEAAGHDGVVFVEDGFVEVVAFRRDCVLDLRPALDQKTAPSFGR